jgi:hypothetical protein
MSLIRIVLLLGMAFVFGCGGGAGSTIGDQNDPSVSGTDQAQGDEKESAVVVSVPE